MKRIILTGGGTAGHVTPNIALLPRLKELGYDIQYIGSYEGIEKKLIGEMQIPYYGISSGKLRRYFDLKNFSDPFKVIKGYILGERNRVCRSCASPHFPHLTVSTAYPGSWRYLRCRSTTACQAG